MPDEYPKEKLKEIYELLPENLKKAIFSNETADDIYDVCVKNGIEKKDSEIAKYAGYVMLGLLSPNEFEKTLKEKLGLESNIAKEISRAITRLVFLPIKSSLEELYKIKIEVPPESTEKPVAAEKASEDEIKEEAVVEEAAKERPIRRKLGQDVYREPIE
jgi:hypothetical protein